MLNILSYLASFGGDDGLEELAQYDPLTAASVERMSGITTVLGGMSVLGILFCFFLMVNRKKLMAQASVALLAAQSVFAVAAVVMLLSTMAGYFNETEKNVLIVAGAVQVLLNILWLMYFLKSRRVQLTFTQ